MDCSTFPTTPDPSLPGAGWSRADEMRSARRVQSRMLPPAVLRQDGLECAGLTVPSRGVGGDFYDFLEAGAGRLALVLGDVSGKGVPAALLAATLQASLRSHYELAPGDLARSLESVNRHFLRWSGTEHYASLFLGEYERASGRLRYANCGHVPPIVLRPGLRVERLRATATVLGIFEGWSGVTAETPLDEGDLLLVASDGVTEATNTRGEPFGDRRLLESLEAHRDLRVAALLRAVAGEVETFCGQACGDDLTLLVARVRGAGA